MQRSSLFRRIRSLVGRKGRKSPVGCTFSRSYAFVLSPADSLVFFEALSNAKVPSEHLKRAAIHAKQITVNVTIPPEDNEPLVRVVRAAQRMEAAFDVRGCMVWDEDEAEIGDAMMSVFDALDEL